MALVAAPKLKFNYDPDYQLEDTKSNEAIKSKVHEALKVGFKLLIIVLYTD